MTLEVVADFFCMRIATFASIGYVGRHAARERTVIEYRFATPRMAADTTRQPTRNVGAQQSGRFHDQFSLRRMPGPISLSPGRSFGLWTNPTFGEQAHES